MSDGVSDPIGVVVAWHEAVNTGDAVRLAELVTDDVELVGPRGPGAGRALVLAWVERAGIQLQPARCFARDGDVVVEQQATWIAPDSGQAGEPHIIATTFLVRNERVARIARYPDLAAALAAVGLDQSHELALPASTQRDRANN
jgi:hypothetical protein